MNIEEVHKNSKLLINGTPYNVDNAEFVKPGKGTAIYRLRLKNLLDGRVLDVTYRSGDKVDEVHITTQEMQYLYQEGDHYVFMNTDNFEQHFITKEQIEDKINFLKEGMIVTVQLMEDTPIEIVIPTFVELAVVETSASIKTATVTAQMKTARLEAGASVDVPAFIKEGDVIKVDTRTGTYVERVSTKK